MRALLNPVTFHPRKETKSVKYELCNMHAEKCKNWKYSAKFTSESH